jgi:hypothetical protein
MKPLALTILLVTAVGMGATPAVGSTAEARYGTGGFTVADVQLLSYGCFYHPYQINLNLGYETTDWSVDARVLAPNGSVFDLAYGYGEGGGPRTIAEEMFFCSSTDSTGTYSITGVLETYEGSSDYTPTSVSLTPATFQVSPYAPPPPPPPPPTATPPPVPIVQPTAVSLKASKLVVAQGQTVRYNFRVTTPTGGPASVVALLERKVSGAWKSYVKARTVNVGQIVRVTKVFRSSRAMKVRARVVGGSGYKASTSRVVTVRPRF